MNAAPTVATLQRELLALVKSEDSFSTWAKVNGLPLNERVSLRASIGKGARVRELRLQIHALDPKAALYFGWHGGEEAKLEFFGLIARRQAARSAA